MPTIKDVAEMSKVSIATVSNVITGVKYVSPAVEKRVRCSIETLGYHPNLAASGLKSSRSKTIGFISPSIDSVFFPQVIRGIQSVTEGRGYLLHFYSTNLQADAERKYLNMLLNSCVDGIIIDSVVSSDDTDYFNALPHLSRRKRKIPVVSIERDLSSYEIPSVSVDNKSAAKAAVMHLVDIGAKNIIHITGPMHLVWCQKRLEGYYEVLKSCGMKIIPDHIISGDFSIDSGYLAVNSLLKQGITFDGLFAANDLMAIGATKALSENGIDVPGTVRIIGFDNITFSALVVPSLSTIHVPKEQMGEEAAKILISAIETPDITLTSQVLPFTLIERQSTNAASRNNIGDVFLTGNL